MQIQVSLEALALNGVTPQAGDTGEALANFTLVESDGQKAMIQIDSINGQAVAYENGQPAEPAERELTNQDLMREAERLDEEDN